MKYVERDLEDQISKYLAKKEIIAVVGVRQCGKTTLVNKILDDQEAKGLRVSRVSFDNLKVLRLFEEDIDSFIELYAADYDFLFIDEVHYSKEGGKKLKYLHDTQPVKVFISGSSAADISVQSLKYLVGRIVILELYPFSFREFLRAKEPRLVPLYDRATYKTEILTTLNNHLHEFILYGGFPRVVTEKDEDEKKIILENIYDTLLLREIRELLDLSEDYKLTTLLKTLSLQIGQTLEYASLSETTGLSYADLKKHLNVLDKTYICKPVTPYYTNKRKELVKSPKIYFTDTGFRNTCIDNFSQERTDRGALYENFIYSELLKNRVTPRYWRTKSQAEVDFILEDNGKPIPVELKSALKSEKLTRSYHSFREKYKPPKGYVLSLEFEKQKENTYYTPFAKFIPNLKK
ncbi:MAG: ATP-binding protein [Candidatus Altiarchaeota archaeon]